MKCSICKEQIIGYGNNANPVNDGSCCNKCNDEVVIVERAKRMGLGHPDSYTKIYIPNFPVELIKERE